MPNPTDVLQEKLRVQACNAANPIPEAKIPSIDFSYVFADLILSLIVLTMQVRITLKRIMYIIARYAYWVSKTVLGIKKYEIINPITKTILQ
jgi:hypothetical protein